MTTAPWDRSRAAHLYRRAGFGGSPDELDQAVSLGREGAVSRLVDYDSISTSDLDDFVGLVAEDQAGGGFGDDNALRFDSLRRWWLLRMQYTPRPLEEKMTLFWSNHFATSVDKVLWTQLMYTQNQIFRQKGMGLFGDLLLDVSRDPAMLIWLDNASNVKDAPNENFAREVMELFTMGVGNYTQRDVTEAARAFTGWTIESEEHLDRYLFSPDAHDGGFKVFLGASGYFRGEDIIAMLAARPETGAFVTAKLARFLLGHDPTPELWQTLQLLYASTRGNIREIVRAILLSDDFDATSQAPDMLKSPVEFVIGANRALGIRVDQDYPSEFHLFELMGMPLFRPPNVGGWKGGRAWMHTDSYLFRMSFASRYLFFPSPWGEYSSWDFSRFFEGRSFQTADELIDFVADRLSLVSVSDALREGLHAQIEPAGQPFFWTPATYGAFGRAAIYLIMVSPEYQIQ